LPPHPRFPLPTSHRAQGEAGLGWGGEGLTRTHNFLNLRKPTITGWGRVAGKRGGERDYRQQFGSTGALRSSGTPTPPGSGLQLLKATVPRGFSFALRAAKALETSVFVTPGGTE